jgi:hypothetical protein
MGSDNQDHVRYPLYNAYKNETLKKNEEIGKTSWETPSPPQIKMHKKNEKEQKTIAKQPCPSLQEDLATVQVCAR